MREGADLLEGHSAVDPVACREPGDVPTGFLDDSGEFIAHDQRHLVGSDELDFTADDHVVERVDRRRHDPDQHFRVAGLRDEDATPHPATVQATLCPNLAVSQSPAPSCAEGGLSQQR